MGQEGILGSISSSTGHSKAYKRPNFTGEEEITSGAWPNTVGRPSGLKRLESNYNCNLSDLYRTEEK